MINFETKLYFDVWRYPPNHVIMTDNFDFFKYAGIHRSVVLYTTPKDFIDDITVKTSVNGATGTVDYSIDIVSEGTEAQVQVTLRDKEGTVVAEGEGASGKLEVANAKLWWPYTMVEDIADAGYLYTLEVLT